MVQASRKDAKKKATQAKQVLETIAMMKSGAIDPEIQSPQIDLQPADGYVNPYYAMGSMAPNVYSAGNMLNGGMVGMPVYNPEA
jgi:hypothetical protein